jgi:hypothetical protein
MNSYEYDQEVKDLAESCFEDFKETALEEGCFDLWELESNHGLDSVIHETVDGSSLAIYMDLHDAADIIKYADNEETDSGLWDGQDPEEAIKTKAFFTLRADVYSKVEEMLKDLEEEQDINLDNAKDTVLESMQNLTLDDLGYYQGVIDINCSKINFQEIAEDNNLTKYQYEELIEYAQFNAEEELEKELKKES